MSKSNSIRQAVNTKFLELLPQLATLGGKAFRRQILDWSVETLKITMAAAATHYNHAFQRIKESEPERVQGLGRPEGKNNGGRKKKTDAAPAAAPGNAILNHMLSVIQKPVLPAPAAVITGAAAMVGLEAVLAAEPQTFTVVRCKDGEEVGTGLSKEEADAMIAKAVAGKKAKLMIKE